MPQDIQLEVRTEVSPATAAAAPFVAILASHMLVDAFAALLPSSLGLLEVRLRLTTEQSAWLLGLGSFASGIAQPISAWISDRLKTRALGLMGIALGVAGIGLLGLASGFVSLAALFALGMIGIGMFHPMGASTIGHLRQHRRTSAVSLFFVAGMMGGMLGALIWPRVLAWPAGFQFLPLAIVPGFLLAWLVYRTIAQLPPMHIASAGSPPTVSARGNWRMVAVLYVAAALRFCVNLSLLYLYVRWVQAEVSSAHTGWTAEQVAAASAPLVGNLNASTLAGMAIGGLLAGMLVRPGREKWPMVLVPIFFAPAIVLFPYLPMSAGYLMAVLAGIGFASMIPVGIALAQHLMPGHSNLVSGMMMGGAWAVAMVGPRCAEYFVATFGLTTAFHLTAAALAVAGILCVPVAGAASDVPDTFIAPAESSGRAQ